MEVARMKRWGNGRILSGLALPLLISFLLSLVLDGLCHIHCISHIRTHLQRSVSLKHGGQAESFKGYSTGFKTIIWDHAVALLFCGRIIDRPE